MRKFLFGAALAVIGLGCVGAQAPAQAQASDPVAVRKAMMRLQAGTFAGMNAAVQAKADPKGLAFGITGLTASAAQLVALFPAGSTANSRAAPAIWSDAAGFAKQAADLGANAEKARVAAAAGDQAAFATAVKAIEDTCTACHTGYRTR